MSDHETAPPSTNRDRDDGEVRNWMLPLADQEFRVPDPGQVRLPEDGVPWSDRLFVLTRWFRRAAMGLTVLSAVIVLIRWSAALLR